MYGTAQYGPLSDPGFTIRACRRRGGREGARASDRHCDSRRYSMRVQGTVQYSTCFVVCRDWDRQTLAQSEGLIIKLMLPPAAPSVPRRQRHACDTVVLWTLHHTSLDWVIQVLMEGRSLLSCLIFLYGWIKYMHTNSPSAGSGRSVARLWGITLVALDCT